MFCCLLRSCFWIIWWIKMYLHYRLYITLHKRKIRCHFGRIPSRIIKTTSRVTTVNRLTMAWCMIQWSSCSFVAGKLLIRSMMYAAVACVGRSIAGDRSHRQLVLPSFGVGLGPLIGGSRRHGDSRPGDVVELTVSIVVGMTSQQAADGSLCSLSLATAVHPTLSSFHSVARADYEIVGVI